MPSYPCKSQWPHQLTDAGGVWCYDCLGYIDPETKKESDKHTRHHIIQRSLVKDLSEAFRIATGQQRCTEWPTAEWWVSASEAPSEARKDRMS